MTGSRYTSSSLWLVDALVVYVVLPFIGATWLLAMWWRSLFAVSHADT